MDEGPFTMPYALGGMKYGLSPYLLANAYSLFPNDGIFKKATTIKCIKELDTNKILEMIILNKYYQKKLLL